MSIKEAVYYNNRRKISTLCFYFHRQDYVIDLVVFIFVDKTTKQITYKG